MSEENNEQMLKVVVDGEEREIPLNQLVAQAQKYLAGDKRLEEGSLARKKAQEEADSLLMTAKEKVKLGEYVYAARNGDMDAQRILAKTMLNLESDDELDQYLNQIQGQFNGNQSVDTGEGTNQNMNGESAKLPDDVVRTLRAFQEFAKPLVNRGYSLSQVGEILSTGITRQSETNRSTLLKQATEKSSKLKSIYAKNPEKVSNLVAAYATQRQGGNELTDEVIRLAVQDAEEILGNSQSASSTSPTIALGDFGATLEGHSKAPSRSMPNMFDDREKSDAAMSKLIAEIAQGDSGVEA